MARQAPGAFVVTDGFRTPEQQAAVRAAKPRLAASGRSKHEDGEAVDVESRGWPGGNEAFHRWLSANVSRFSLFQERMPDEPYHLVLQ